jgi:ribonuclease BN (tRNA processing enzyme)
VATRLTVVGDAAAWTRRPGHASSCYLVQHHDAAIVLDFGQGAFSALARHIAPEAIDGVLISHLHADHIVDLIPLRHYLSYEATEHHAIGLRGPAELRSRFDAFQAHPDLLETLPGQPLEPGTFEFAGFRVETRRVTHIPDSFAFRIEPPGGGPALAYSGDCSEPEDLLPLVHEGDTLLCEAAYGASTRPADALHLTAAEAASVAQRGRAARLIITHIQDRQSPAAALAAARDAFTGDVLLAESGLAVEVE